ncbi:MAG: DUF4298 domain-containing protein [Flavobacteriaceae bacterium]|nr:DUF4298 domain-containing protein [Flavobacteriaceae bacterium]
MDETLDQKLERLQQIQDLFDEVKPEVEGLMNIFVQYSTVSNKVKQLQEFYQQDWMDFYDNLPVAEQDKFEIMGQDALWNLITDHHRIAHRFMRHIVNQITQEE